MIGPFQFESTTKVQATIALLDEEEFAEALLTRGWSQAAVDMELEELREYRRRFVLPEGPDPRLLTSDGPLADAIHRRRRRGRADN